MTIIETILEDLVDLHTHFPEKADETHLHLTSGVREHLYFVEGDVLILLEDLKEGGFTAWVDILPQYPVEGETQKQALDNLIKVIRNENTDIGREK